MREAVLKPGESVTICLLCKLCTRVKCCFVVVSEDTGNVKLNQLKLKYAHLLYNLFRVHFWQNSTQECDVL